MRVLGLIAALILATLPVQAQAPMVADISERRIGIDSGFKGTELLLFGSLSEPGDVVIVVKGPSQELTVRRKSRIAGIWVNAESLTFEDAPGFYVVASNRPLDEIASDYAGKLKVAKVDVDANPDIPGKFNIRGRHRPVDRAAQIPDQRIRDGHTGNGLISAVRRRQSKLNDVANCRLCGSVADFFFKSKRRRCISGNRFRCCR